MFRVDESEWPIVTMHFEGEPMDLEEMEEYISYWDKWFDLKEPMAVTMISQHEGKEKAGKEVTELAKRWREENRERIGKYCVGIALVPRPSKLMAVFKVNKPIVGWVMKKRMGCPGQVFDDDKEARAWLEERMAEARGHQAV